MNDCHLPVLLPFVSAPVNEQSLPVNSVLLTSTWEKPLGSHLSFISAVVSVHRPRSSCHLSFLLSRRAHRRSPHWTWIPSPLSAIKINRQAFPSKYHLFWSEFVGPCQDYTNIAQKGCVS